MSKTRAALVAANSFLLGANSVLFAQGIGDSTVRATVMATQVAIILGSFLFQEKRMEEAG